MFARKDFFSTICDVLGISGCRGLSSSNDFWFFNADRGIPFLRRLQLAMQHKRSGLRYARALVPLHSLSRGFLRKYIPVGLEQLIPTVLDRKSGPNVQRQVATPPLLWNGGETEAACSFCFVHARTGLKSGKAAEQSEWVLLGTARYRQCATMPSAQPLASLHLMS